MNYAWQNWAWTRQLRDLWLVREWHDRLADAERDEQAEVDRYLFGEP